MPTPSCPLRHVLTAATLLLTVAASSCARADTVTVRDDASLREALRTARPGTTILLAPGDYRGGLSASDLRGTPTAPIVIAAADPANPPRIRGGGSALHLSRVAHLELRDLRLSGAAGNGLNIDDGGRLDAPSHHVTLRRVTVTEVGPQGNRDGIKLSGLADFQVLDCTVEQWGSGGSGIDMVGCHRGLIQGCTFREGGATGVQAKGGSAEITVRRCRFENGGSRAVNIGGSTGLPYFRPRPQGYEAKDIRVEGNTFVGSDAPISFVGVDGATVRFNTIYRPRRWAFRILQETVLPDFVPSRRGVVEDNIIVFRSDAWFTGGINIGGNTAPETFRFARNVWYCEDHPERSRPQLPVAEADAMVGRDPLLRDAEKGDFTLREGSPAAGRGATGLR